MRSWRRGTKEMDLVLGPFAEAHLAAMDPALLALYDALLLGKRSGSFALGDRGQDPAPIADLCRGFGPS